VSREIVALTLPPSQVTADVAAGLLPHFRNPTLGSTAQPTASETGKEISKSTTARHAAFAELQAEKDALVKQLAESTKQLAKSIKDKERLANELAVAARDNDRLGKQLADLKLQCRVRDNSTAHSSFWLTTARAPPIFCPDPPPFLENKKVRKSAGGWLTCSCYPRG
jgi:septal ring factor EnvC (AmiA/AmiB activator)